MKNKEVGLLIKTARENKGWTQAVLAEKVSMSRSYIADMEAGRYTPSLSTMVNIANTLSVDLNLLLAMTEIQDSKEGVTA